MGIIILIKRISNVGSDLESSEWYCSTLRKWTIRDGETYFTVSNQALGASQELPFHSSGLSWEQPGAFSLLAQVSSEVPLRCTALCRRISLVLSSVRLLPSMDLSLLSLCKEDFKKEPGMYMKTWLLSNKQSLLVM